MDLIGRVLKAIGQPIDQAATENDERHHRRQPGNAPDKAQHTLAAAKLMQAANNDTRDHILLTFTNISWTPTSRHPDAVLRTPGHRVALRSCWRTFGTPIRA